VVFKVYLACARACYGTVVIVAAGIAAFGAYLLVISLFGSYYALVTAVVTLPFLFLSTAAIRRRLRGSPMLPQPANHGEWMLVFFMWFPAVLAHFLVFNVCLAIYQYRYVYPERDVEGGPMAFFMIIAAACYLAALLMIELGLTHGRQPSQQAPARLHK
jgi:hypothetical protein